MSITQAVDEILHFLEDIPLSPNSVKHYGCCYQEILKYCSRHALESFSHQDAGHFYSTQTERVQMGEICETYAMMMRKAAFSLADYFSSGVISWRRKKYEYTSLPEKYELVLECYQSYLSASLALGSVQLVVQMARKFLFFLVESDCNEISSMDISCIRIFVSPKANLPYLFTDKDLEHFFAATDCYPHRSNSPLLEYIVPVIFRLQYSCGLRPQEVRLLKRVDFDFRKNTIYISESKWCKDRCLPVSPEIMGLCKRYDTIAQEAFPDRTYFFPSKNGTAYTHES